MGFTWCPLWSAGLHFFHLGLQGQPRVRRSLVAWCFHPGFLPWNIRNIYEIYVPIYEMWISMKVKPAVEIPAGSKASKPSNIWGYLIFFLVENLWAFFRKMDHPKEVVFFTWLISTNHQQKEQCHHVTHHTDVANQSQRQQPGHCWIWICSP